MKALFFLPWILLMTGFSAWAASTSTGIPIDAPWKQKVYDFAKENVVHPSWGIMHSERDYQIALSVAQEDRIPIDTDALFAAAFLHDLGGIGKFAKPGVDHAVRSAELVEPMLQSWGFPMAKWPQVRDLILGHVYYGPKPESQAAQAFRDADILDFLGAMGVARILAANEELGGAGKSMKPSVDVLRQFASQFPAKLSLNASKKKAIPRLNELDAFLRALDAESFNGAAL